MKESNCIYLRIDSMLIPQEASGHAIKRASCIINRCILIFIPSPLYLHLYAKPGFISRNSTVRQHRASITIHCPFPDAFFNLKPMYTKKKRRKCIECHNRLQPFLYRLIIVRVSWIFHQHSFCFALVYTKSTCCLSPYSKEEQSETCQRNTG
jgi:hypothetical protein